MRYRLSHGFGVYRSGEGHVLFEPVNHRRDGTRPGVITCKGATAQPLYTVYLTGLQQNSDERTRAGNGWVSMCAELGGGSPWGNDTCMAAMTEAYNYLLSTAGVKGTQVVLTGGSGGAPNAINWALRNPEKVAAIHQGIPALDMQDMHDNNRANVAAGMEAAYGGLAGLEAAYATRSPVEMTSAIAALDIPINLYYSSNDPYCLPEIVEEFATATGARAVSVGATGHSVPDPQGVQWFLEDCALYS